MTEEVKVIDDVESVKLATEESRNKILNLLKINDMTIAQMAEALDRDQSTVYRHIKKLEDHGFVKECEARWTHRIQEKVYKRCASVFLFAPEPMNKEQLQKKFIECKEKETRLLLKRLDIAGYNNPLSEEVIEDLSDFFSYLKEIMVPKIYDNEIKEGTMGFYNLVRFHTMLILLEGEKNPDFREKIKNIASHFEL
ncbi:MAG: winged helix-turn-helix domain-containing protein [Thermoplasmata archaeon]